VHTPDDIEFFCEGWQTDRRGRRRQYVLELLLGNIAWEISCLYRLKRQGKITSRTGLETLAKRLLVFFALMAVVGLVEPGAAWRFAVTSALTIWAGSVMTRHNQWIEHLGIVSDGSLAERNLLTRNVRSDRALGWLFNLMNHNDPLHHVYHHTEPKLQTRALSGLALPPGARVITVPEYLRLLVEHYRSL
jgi:hypothetical protein